MINDKTTTDLVLSLIQQEETELYKLTTCIVCGTERPFLSNPATTEQLDWLKQSGWSIFERRPKFESLTFNPHCMDYTYSLEFGWLCSNSQCHKIVNLYKE